MKVEIIKFVYVRAKQEKSETFHDQSIHKNSSMSAQWQPAAFAWAKAFKNLLTNWSSSRRVQ
jgi:hypothetical protein